ncbi:MAG: hypothetical protein ABI665_04145 [Vicinamibacterales bacterium]
MFVDAFILAYLVVAWCWRLPAETPGHRLIQPIADWLVWAGLDQSWSMFTPDPPQAEHDLQAVIRRRSGSGVLWEPPSMRELSRWQAFLAFRYREYASSILTEEEEACQPALIDYLLRKYDLADDPPVEVVLWGRRTPVAGPGSAIAPGPPDNFVVHTHRVEDEA